MTIGPSSESPAPLNYEPASRSKITGREIRFIILLCAVLLGAITLLANPVIWQNGWLGWGIFGTPVGPFENGALDDRIYYVLHAAGFLSLFLFTQWLFLLPRGRLSFQTSDRGRSRVSSVIGAGFIGMLLTAGMAASIMELVNVWQYVFKEEIQIGPRNMRILWFHGLWVGMALAWLLWAIIFYWYYRDADHHTAVARMTRALLAGTILELLISVPAYVKSIQQPSDCYCEKGSYTGLVFGCTAVFWLFGPGVYLLLLREKRRWTPKV
jgi:hypothetical protein